MSPPEQKETVVLDNTVEEKQIDIKQLAREGYYFEFPEKKVILLQRIINMSANLLLNSIPSFQSSSIRMLVILLILKRLLCSIMLPKFLI